MSRPIYLDAHATTPLDAAALEAMIPWLRDHVGNAASRSHVYGWEAGEAVEAARAQVAALIGGRASEIVFTSGATEADNLALKGAVEARPDRRHVLVSRTEHKAVIDTARRLERAGVTVGWLDVDAHGRVDVAEVEARLQPDTALVSVMFANNVAGTIQPIAELGALAKARDVWLHCDAAQGLSLLPFDVEALGVDLVSLSAHKMHGPQGIGALWVRRRSPRVSLVAQMDGGGHERGLRSGTLPVALLVGFGAAAELAVERRAEDGPRVGALRDRLAAHLTAELEGVHLHGPALDSGHRHPGNLNVSFDGVSSESLLLALREVVALSSGSACSSADLAPSYVLRAMGTADDLAHASVRIGLSRETTPEEIAAVGIALVSEVTRLRSEAGDARDVDW